MHSNLRNVYTEEHLKPSLTKKTIIELKKESTPPGASPKVRRKKLPALTMELEGKLKELLDIYEEEKKKTRELSEIIFSNQDKHIKREKEYKRTLNECEKLLFPGKDSGYTESTGKYREKIRKKHKKILDEIDKVQQRSIFFLHEHEKLIVKELNQELNLYYKKIQENQRNSLKNVISTTKESLRKEIISNRAEVEKVEQANNVLQKENKDLKIEFKSYENDVAILNSNIESLKQQGVRLKTELQSLKEKHVMSKTQEFFRISSRPVNTERVRTSTNDDRLIDNIKRMIEIEKKNLRAAKNAYTRELQERNELESILRSAIDDFVVSPRGKISSRSNLSPRFKSKKETIMLLYSKMFPSKRNQKRFNYDEVDSDILIEHLDKNIENIEKLYSQHEQSIQVNTERAQMGY